MNKHKFLPTYFESSMYNINFLKYYKIGDRFLIFDIDNTLVLHDEKVNLNVKKYIKYYIYNAHKPHKANFIKLMSISNHNLNDTLFIGEQLFTDILGANKINMKSILVKPIGKEIYLHIYLKRLLEKLIIFYYTRIIKII